MKKFLKLSALVSTLIISASAFAHGDHGPTQVQPTKGGVIQKAESFYMEVVGSKTEVKFYPLREEGSSKMLKPIPLAEVKLEATYTIPRGKPTPITVSKANDHFVGSIKAGSAHRYQVDAKIQAGKDKDTLTFQVEPQE